MKQPTPKPIKPQDATQPRKGSTTKQAREASLIYERVRGVLRYENDGTGSIDTQVSMRVQNHEGVQKAGQLIFEYNTEHSALEIKYVRVIKPDGTIVSAKSDAVQDLSAPVASSAPMYTDTRQKHVVVPNLAIGDRVEYETLRTDRPLTPGQFWLTWNLITDDICLDEQVELNIPKSREIHWKAADGALLKLRTEGDRKIYQWTSQTETPESSTYIPNLKDIKSMLRGAVAQHPKQILVSTFNGWNEVADWYAELEKDRRVPSAEVKAKAQAVTKDAKSDLEKVQLVYEYVASSIRYVSLSFGVGRYQPHSADTVLSNQYGDCKDKATLLESMLDALGVKASAVLLQTNWDADPDVPSPLQFDHAISYVELPGNPMFLDSTAGVAPFRYLFPQVRGREALVVVNGKSNQLTKIPEALAVPTSYHLDLTGSIDRSGGSDFTLGFETRGDLEVLVRATMLRLPPAKWMELITAGARSKNPDSDVQFENLKVSDAYDTHKPLRVEIQVSKKAEIKKSAKTDGSGLAAAADVPLDKDIVNFFLPEPSKSGGEWKPVQLNGPRELLLHAKLDVQAPEAAKDPPQKGTPRHLSTDFAKYDGQWEWDGKSVSADFRLTYLVNEVPSDKAGAYNDFRTHILDSFDEMKKMGHAGSTSASSGKKSADAGAEQVMKYSVAIRELEGGKSGQGISKLEALVAEKPDYVDAWRSLGDAYRKRFEMEKARKAYEQVIALHPADSTGYAGVIQIYRTQNKYDEAIEVARKQIEAKPDGSDGHWALAALFYQQQRWPEAILEYEATVKILPKSSRLRVLLGYCYGQTHDFEKAKAAYKKGIELSDTATTWNDVAYNMSENGMNLPEAEIYARQAVAAVEQQMNQLDPENVESDALRKTVTLSYYWDTLGWIYFQQQRFNDAQAYLQGAADVGGNSTIFMHLGQVYEKLGQKENAIDSYAVAVGMTSFGRRDLAAGVGQMASVAPFSPDEKVAYKRLIDLTGGETKAKARLREAMAARSDRSAVTFPFAQQTEESEDLSLLVDKDGTIHNLRQLRGTTDLKTVLQAQKDLKLPQKFPDKTLEKMPRAATLRCSGNTQSCTLQLLPAAAGIDLLTLLEKPEEKN